MGGNLQKGKTPSEQPNNKNKGKSQLLQFSEDDLKMQAHLGDYRWFYTKDFTNWERYNFLSEKQKEKVLWIIFPLEISYEIERHYTNKMPYEKDNTLIIFDYFQQKHMLIGNNNNTME